MGLKDVLRDAVKGWDEVIEDAGKSSFENLPDGSYIVQLTGMELGESKTSEKAQVKCAYTVLEGECAGRTIYDFIGLENSMGMKPLGWRLRDFGVALADVNPADFQSTFDDLVENLPAMKVRLATKGKYQNLKVDRLLPNYDLPDDDEVELEVGMRVSFPNPDSDDPADRLVGEITEISDDEETATVERDDNGEALVVKVEDLLLETEEGDDE